MVSINSMVVLGKDGDPYVVEERIENTNAPVVQVSSSIITPHLALKHIRERDDDLHRALAEAGCQGTCVVQAGYNLEMLKKSGGMLQEIIVTIQDKGIPRTLIPELADIFFPFPGTLRMDSGIGISHAIPIMPPQDSLMGEVEYWRAVTSFGLCTGYDGCDGLPGGRPAFIKHVDFDLHKRQDHEREKVWWRLWKRS
ncbi:hypothetical protein BDZ94DRAFT_1249987 [Collybia nuda]|uniref:Uncharacterized protein n=1 Tax=Collybia nuda TaxID=64659 RepID=A0A9P6CM17_9AGAR|nr:hypothetical protein BDZ94DRAFT_1249987 [Collybia nuda]